MGVKGVTMAWGKASFWALSGLVAVVGGGVLAAKVIAPPIIKDRLEAELTKAWQAEVNVGAVDIHLLPIGVTIRQIQLTDPNQPTRNLAVIGSAYAEPALIDMLKMDMKPILDEVDVAGIRLYQKRAQAGRVYKKPDRLVDQTKALAQRGLPPVRLPDPEKILKTEKLETVEQAEQLKRQLEALRKQWQALQEALPNKQTLAQYEAELNKLKQGGLNPQALQQFEQLKKRIEADRRKLEEAKTLLVQAEQLKKALTQLKNLPAEDLKRLQRKYTFNAAGMTHLAQTLLGEQVRAYLQVATGWIARVKPLLEKKKTAQSAEPNPALDTLVRRLRINGQLPTGRFDAQADNVTLNQALYQVTTPYRVDFQHINADKPVTVSGVADLLKPTQAQIKALLEGVGVHLKDLPLSESPTLVLVLKQAQASLKGRADVISWEQIKGEVNARFDQVALDLLKTAQPQMQRYLKPVLSQVKDFKLTVKFDGSLYAPRILIRSDLDRILGKGLQRMMQQQLNAVKQQLRVKLEQKARTEMGQLSDMLQPLLAGKGQVERLDKRLQSLLSAQLGSGKKPLPVQLPGGLKLPF